MYLIVVYDVEEDRVAKVLKCGRKYLNWVQNSVLEGEITEAKFEKFKRELNDIIEKDKDSIIFYILREQYYAKKEILGVVKNDLDNIL